MGTPRFWQTLASITIFALAVGRASALEPCVVEYPIGMLSPDGHCTGFSEEFAKKYLHILSSQCKPASEPGHVIIGNCIVDRDKTLAPEQTERPINQRAFAEIVMQAIDVLRAEIASIREENAYLQSRVDLLESRLSPKR